MQRAFLYNEGLKWHGTQGTPFPRLQFMVKYIPNLRYPKGHTGMVMGAHVTTQKSTETENLAAATAEASIPQCS